MKKVIIGLMVLAVIGVIVFFVFRSKDTQIKYITEQVTLGDIKSIISATGTVNAVKTVQVGTQVSGTIKELFVDYNSSVKKGQILAQIDPAVFEAQVGQARANLSAAYANLEKAQVLLRDAKATWERNKILYEKNFISKSDLDTSETNHLSAAAQIKIASAQIEQTKAALDSSSINLKYTRILSPVNGTVINRNIDVGQTVAASFQTPTLFTIAQDLTKMQIDTNIDEADISSIKVGQKVDFTVDAHPDSPFVGKVEVIRNAPITIQNVVTYNAVITVDNSSLKLKPGMTANVSIETQIKQNVLRLPSAALRFKPAIPQAKNGASLDRTKPKSPRGPMVWVLENKKPKPVNVTIGITDGSHTEMIAGNLTAGQPVIIDSVGAVKKPDQPPGGGVPRMMR